MITKENAIFAWAWLVVGIALCCSSVYYYDIDPLRWIISGILSPIFLGIFIYMIAKKEKNDSKD